jgi:hypothetical protein
VAARKVLAMMMVRTLQTLNGVTVIECLDVNRLRLARPSLHVTNIPQPAFRGNRSSVLVSMTNVTAKSFCICFGTCADRSHALMDRLRLHEQRAGGNLLSRPLTRARTCVVPGSGTKHRLDGFAKGKDCLQ